MTSILCCWRNIRGNEVSGDYLLSTLLAGFDFDDPIDVFGQLFVTKGGRWYQRRSLPELDKLFEQQNSSIDPEARKKVIYGDGQTRDERRRVSHSALD